MQPEERARLDACTGKRISVGITADGIVGKVTLSYLNTPNSEAIFYRLRSEREDYYTEIVRNNPSQRVFLNGWLRRSRSFEYHE